MLTRLAGILLTLACLTGCGSDDDEPSSSVIAWATGSDLALTVGDVTYLRAVVETRGDATIYTYGWTTAAGPAPFLITEPWSLATSARADTVGSFTVLFTVYWRDHRGDLRYLERPLQITVTHGPSGSG